MSTTPYGIVDRRVERSYTFSVILLLVAVGFLISSCEKATEPTSHSQDAISSSLGKGKPVPTISLQSMQGFSDNFPIAGVKCAFQLQYSVDGIKGNHKNPWTVLADDGWVTAIIDTVTKADNGMTKFAWPAYTFDPNFTYRGSREANAEQGRRRQNIHETVISPNNLQKFL